MGALLRARNPIGVITKGPMIVRDRDLLAELSRAAGCTVYMSVPTVDEDAWRILEPGTAHPLQRLRAVRELTDAGVTTGVLMNPIVPGFSSARAKIQRTVKAIADHGARFVGCSVMFLEEGTRAHFMQFLEREFPSWLPRYDKLYAKKYAPQDYRRQVQGMVRVLQARYNLRTRKEADAEHSSAAASPETEQVGFAW
jgi:DNA repair photolyase